MKKEQKIHIVKDYYLILPKNYKKVKLPGRNKWIAALRSGKYRRTTGTLCETNNKKLCYCCLGVLSKVQNRLKKAVLTDNWMDGYSHSTLGTSNPVYSILRDCGRFPPGVVIICCRNEGISPTYNELTLLNDVINFSFKNIANVIELIWKN